MFSLSVMVMGNMSERRKFSGCVLFDGRRFEALRTIRTLRALLHGDKPITSLNNACHLSDSEPGSNAGTSPLMSDLPGVQREARSHTLMW